VSAVGTWAWAERTGGRLRRRDRAELLRQGVLARLSRVPVRLRASASESISIDVPVPPDSALARAADERVRELSSVVLYGHCQRTWAFAAMFAAHQRIRHDEELLYLACMLHDLGLTSAHDGADPTARCFAVEGARAAHDLICQQGDSQTRAQAVAEAITLHLNVTVPARMGAEAHLLSKGVSLETVGRRLHQLPLSSVRQVGRRWPRDGFTEYLVGATSRQAEIRHQSRSAFLHRLGFPGLLRANPLDS
jgi:HD domain